MKLKDAIDLYKNTKHLNSNNVIILFPEGYKQFKMVKTRKPLRCIRWRTDKREDLWYDKFSLFEMVKDNWEICELQDWKGIRKGDPVLKAYILRTNILKSYARC